MTDQSHMDESRPGALKAQTGANKVPVASAQTPPANPGAAPASADEPSAVKNLSAEEQLALYEQDLKENDWGHQPC